MQVKVLLFRSFFKKKITSSQSLYTSRALKVLPTPSVLWKRGTELSPAPLSESIQITAVLPRSGSTPVEMSWTTELKRPEAVPLGAFTQHKKAQDVLPAVIRNISDSMACLKKSKKFSRRCKALKGESICKARLALSVSDQELPGGPWVSGHN